MRIVVLLGPPGSGKTYVGAVLSRRLGWIFNDTERWLVDRSGSRGAVLAEKDEVLASIERLGARGAGGDLNNDVVFTREFHAFWEREIATRFQWLLEIDSTDGIDDDTVVERVRGALTD